MQPVGLLTLDANPRNYFAETEQVAFHVGHLVRGIDVTDDPLMQGRLFSYLDTQISRLGGPNFTQLPINRPHAPVNDMLRDGMHQSADHVGVAPYRPNSLDGGCPFHAGADLAFIDVPTAVGPAVKERGAPASFDDHFSQPRLFWASLSPVEKAHTAQAYTFELGKCYEQAIKERQLQALANIDAELCATVADGPGSAGAQPDAGAGRRHPERRALAGRRRSGPSPGAWSVWSRTTRPTWTSSRRCARGSTTRACCRWSSRRTAGRWPTAAPRPSPSARG